MDEKNELEKELFQLKVENREFQQKIDDSTNNKLDKNRINNDFKLKMEDLTKKIEVLKNDLKIKESLLNNERGNTLKLKQKIIDYEQEINNLNKKLSNKEVNLNCFPYYYILIRMKCI